MAYREASPTNANFFSATAASGGIADIINDVAGWSVTVNSANLQFTVTKTFNTTETLRFRFQRAATNSPSFKLKMSPDGTDWTKELTVTLTDAATYTGTVNIYSSVLNNRGIFVFGIQSGSSYSYKAIYFGAIAAFDPADKNCWGIWASGAPELAGKNFPSEGLGLSVQECFLMRSIETKTASSKPIIPFTFVDLQGYDDLEMDYNSYGYGNNSISASSDFTGPSLRDLFEEEKALGSRMNRIGLFKEYHGLNGKGFRGTLDGLYKVNQSWVFDSVGANIPHRVGAQFLAAKVYTSSFGSKNFAGEDDWVVFPLDNNVNNNYIYNGLKVIAFPKR